MTIAYNQPYLFPYLGYFQLMAAADVFVAADSLQYVSRSYINRNNLLAGGNVLRITSPVKKNSFDAAINERVYVYNFLDNWIKALQYNYARAECFSPVMGIMEELRDMKIYNVADFNVASIRKIAEYLCIKAEIRTLSGLGISLSGDKHEKTLGIVKSFNADKYINLPGGRQLYSVDYFASQGVDLKFLNPFLPEYRQQRTGQFHPRLSILDVMMNCPVGQIQEMLGGATFSH